MAHHQISKNQRNDKTIVIHNSAHLTFNRKILGQNWAKPTKKKLLLVINIQINS